MGNLTAQALVEEQFYLSGTSKEESEKLQKVSDDTGLAYDEIESLVGRFRPHSMRAGQLRGQVFYYLDDRIEIRHHFTKKLLWRNT